MRSMTRSTCCSEKNCASVSIEPTLTLDEDTVERR